MNTKVISDTKPQDYNYLTFSLITSGFHDEKAELLLNLEKMLLKSLMTGITSEGPISSELVTTFECSKPSRALTVWFSHILPDSRLSRKLVKTHRFRWN